MKQLPRPPIEFEALGVPWWVQADEVDPLKIQTIVDKFDKRWSRFRSNSIVADMAKQSGSYKLTSDELRLVQFYKALYAVSDGRVTPFIATALEDLGYDATYSFKERTPEYRPKLWEDVLEVDHSHLIVKQPMMLDIGAAGKGYAVDQVATVIEGEGIVDASGDILVKGIADIGLQDPADHRNVIGRITLTNQAICGSSIFVRAWNGQHHVLDGRTGLPTTEIIATWAVADTAMVADGLATALFFVDPKQLYDLGLTDYCIIYADKSVAVHPKTKVQLFTV